MEVFELFIMSLIALMISFVCWGLLNVPLRRTLAFLCDDDRDGVKEVAALFWQRLYLGLTLFSPLLCVLLFVPNIGNPSEQPLELGNIILYSLRWAIFGGMSLLLILAVLVRKQIHYLQTYHQYNHKTNQT